MPTANPNSGAATPSAAGSTSELSSRRLLLAPVWLVAGLVVIALALMTTVTVTMRAPAAKGTDASATTFSAARALPIVEDLLGDGTPHPVGSAANEAVRERLRAQFAAAGYDTSVQEEFVCREVFSSCGYVENVLARLEGRGDGPAVMVVAHYDSVPAAPGASDDLAAVAAIVEVARMLKSEGPLRNPVIFLITDGEEMGLLGAQAFVDHHPWAREIGVVVNFEARGSRGQSMLFEAAGGNAWLVREFAREAPRPVTNSLAYEIYRALPNDTDFTVFREAGMSGINFAYIDGVTHYHTPRDDLSTMSRSSLQHHGDNLLAAARAFGEADLQERREGDALFIDLLPGSVTQVPISWALPLSVLALLAWLSLALVSVRTNAAARGAIAIALLAVLAALALAAAAAQGAASALVWLAGSDSPWHAFPLPSRIAVWGSAAAGALIPLLAVARLAAFWGLTIGVWLVWALLCLALAILLPGASVVFLVPLLVATALLGVVLLSPARKNPSVAAGATLLTIFVTAYGWLPLSLSVEQGVGLGLSAAIGITFALASSGAFPLLAFSRARSSTGVGLLAAVLTTVVIAGVVALLSPPVTTAHPQRMSIIHHQDFGSGPAIYQDPQASAQFDSRSSLSNRPAPSAAWLVAPSVSSDLPPAMRDAADFSTERSRGLLGTGQMYFEAPAPISTGSGPTVRILSDEMQDGERVLRLRLDSEREPLRLELRVDGDVVLNEIVFESGETIEYGPPTDTETQRVECNGARCTGTELALRMAGPERFELQVNEYVDNLPEGAEPLLAARPSSAVASQDGDVSIASAVVRIGEHTGN